MSLDVTDPAQVGERPAARVTAWLEARVAEFMDEELEMLLPQLRRDPYWLELAETCAISRTLRDFQGRQRDPLFLLQFFIDG